MYNFDLLVKGARLVDPGSGQVGDFDVAVNGGYIAGVEKDIPRAQATRVIEGAGLILTAGFIDLHAHICHGITRHGIDPDRAGVLQGVTTIVDGGSVGSHTFVGLRKHVLPHARTRIFNFLNLSYSGQAWMPEVRTLADIDRETLTLVLRSNRDVVKGVKIRAVSPAIEVIGAQLADIAHEYADLIEGRVMLHIGDHHAWEGASKVTREIIGKLRPGDILTHPYTSWPGGALQDDGEPFPEVRDAVARGVVVDVGRGMMNFTVENARRALATGFIPDTISTDITLMTIHGPVFGLADTASIFLSLGMDLEDVIARITVNSATALGIEDQLGTVAPGKVADLTLSDYREDGDYEFHGFEAERYRGSKLLVPIMTIKGGEPIPTELPTGSAMYHAREGAKGEAT